MRLQAGRGFASPGPSSVIASVFEAAEAMDRAVLELLDQLASKKPSPAAGAVAALSLAQGAALGLKAVRVSLTSRADGPEKSRLLTAEAALVRVIEQAIPKFDEDVQAVQALMTHFKTRRHHRRGSAGPHPTQGALDDAMRVPMSILSLAGEGLAALESVTTITKRALTCESGASAKLMWAAAEISHSVLLNNAVWLEEHRDWSSTLARADHARTAAKSCYETVDTVVKTDLEDQSPNRI